MSPGETNAIDTIGKIVLELIGILNPSDVDKVEKALEERRKEIVKKKKAILEAVATGDADAVNAIIFGD